jgi:hypothetical protein
MFSVCPFTEIVFCPLLQGIHLHPWSFAFSYRGSRVSSGVSRLKCLGWKHWPPKQCCPGELRTHEHGPVPALFSAIAAGYVGGQLPWATCVFSFLL